VIGPRYVAREVDCGALMGRESAPGFALARVAADGSRGQELVLVRGDGEYVCMRRGFEDAEAEAMAHMLCDAIMSEIEGK